MNFLKKIINIENKNSISTKIRQKNFKYFKDLFYSLYNNKPLKILDIGGTQEYWEMMEFTDPNLIEVTIISIDKIQVTLPNFRFVKMSAEDFDLLDFNCDIVFSHSLIEHIDHEIFAQIVRCFEKPYFIQTPNKYFPIEPHFLIPFFNFFPTSLKSYILGKAEEAKTINLLSKEELKKLFPNSKIYEGKIFRLTQSFAIVKKQ
jgi:hypothetical protein